MQSKYRNESVNFLGRRLKVSEKKTKPTTEGFDFGWKALVRRATESLDASSMDNFKAFVRK